MFIGIDVGTSFIKAAAIDIDKFELKRLERVPFPDFVMGCEADPAEVLGAVERLLARMGVETPAGVVLCGQMHGFVLVNHRGEAVSNYVSWLDRRVSPADFAEIEALVPVDWRAELGNEFRASIALSILYWLKQRRRLPEGSTPVSIADFVAGRLCGCRPVLEPTQAAAFGALRLATLDWHREVIESLGLNSLRWPDVRPAGSVVGKWKTAPVYAAAGDQQCALAGALLSDRELSVNIGTGSQVALLCDRPGKGALQVRPYFDGRFLRTITHIPGGRALSALVSLLTELGGASEKETWTLIDAKVAQVASTDMRAGTAFFPGPCGDRGFLENLREENLNVGHVFRAVYESMSRNYATCARLLDPQAAAGQVVFSGGVARRNPLLRELVTQALQLPCRLSPHPEDTLYGLMVLARKFYGSGSP